MSAVLKSHSIGTTMVLTIHNPTSHNALVPEICAAAVEAINAADSNPEVHSIIITGEGANFCSGGPALAKTDPRTLSVDRQAEFQAESVETLHSWIEVVHSVSKPVIAAVEGQCSNAGFSLALACDFVVAAHDAVFSMEQATAGLSPNGGGSWSLVRNLPRASAMQLLMLGEHATASRLEQLGLVNRVCEPGQALTQALSLGQRLNALSPKALASIKELVNDAQDHSLSAHLKQERDHFRRNRLRWGGTGEAVH